MNIKTLFYFFSLGSVLSLTFLSCANASNDSLTESFEAATKELMSDEYGVFVWPHEFSKQKSHARHILSQLREIDKTDQRYETSSANIQRLISSLGEILAHFTSLKYKKFLKEHSYDLETLGVVDPIEDPSWK